MEFQTSQGTVEIPYLDVARWTAGVTMVKQGSQQGVLIDLDPAIYGMPRVFMPLDKIAKAVGMADIARGQVRADAFLDEMEKIAATVEPHASIGNVVGEHEGAPGVSEALLGRQHSVERKAEEARQLGEPSSDKLQKIISRFKGQNKTAADDRSLIPVAHGFKVVGATPQYHKRMKKAIERLSPEEKSRIGAHLRKGKRVGTAVGALSGAAAGALTRRPVGVLAGGILGGVVGRRAGGVRGTRRSGEELHKALQKRNSAGQGKTAAVTSIGYSKYFKNKMHMRGITSPTQLSEKGKKDFYNSVDSGWHSSQEKAKKLRSA